MSGIAGIYHLDGAPVDPQVLQRMAEAAAFRGPDGIHFWIDGPIGLAHLALHTTPEALREQQPLRSRDGRLCLAADARVDNRAELISALTSRGIHLEYPTDADLILAAYEVWGPDSPKEIIGDFAFAVWDSRERRLFLTRDPIGIRPLFYCRLGETLFFASTIEPIVAGLGERPPWNEPLLMDFLCWWFDRWVDETIYQGIRRLPAAHGLEVRPEGERLARYWTLGLQPGPGCKTDEEYIGGFRQLFAEAVRCRLRSNTPVGISVSGGLDSSSIACMAHYLRERGEPQPQVRLYSVVFKDYPAADERRYLQAVLEKCRDFPATCLPGEDFWAFKVMGLGSELHLDEPDLSPIRGMMIALLQEARQDGCRVMLSGEGGDQLLNASAYWMPELLADVPLGQRMAEFRYFWRRTRWATLRALARGVMVPVLKPLVPRRLLEWRRRRLQQKYRLARLRSVPVWVNRARVSPLPTVQDESADPAAWLPSRSALTTYGQLTSGWYTAALGQVVSEGALQGIEYRMPFLDRRMADWMLQIPPSLRFAKGLTKVILRRAMVGILVEEVRQRTTFAYFSDMIDLGLREKERDRIEALLKAVATSLGQYVQKDGFAFSWRSYYNGSSLSQRPFLAPLLFLSWLRSFPSGTGDEQISSKEVP